MKHFALGHRLPRWISNPLFGDRQRFGLVVQQDDPDWRAWQDDVCQRFYQSTQKDAVGDSVSDAGYRVMRQVDLDGLRVLELGPGHIRHLQHWKGRPACYVIADIRREMLQASAAALARAGVNHEAVQVAPGEPLPFPDQSFDLVVSFYALEHMYPFGPYLGEIVRVLRHGGGLIGAIPAEGGVAWGLGRFLTTRRWLKRNSSIDPDKIICWEHPNCADGLLEQMDLALHRQSMSYWPLRLPLLDVNLVVRFLYRRAAPAPAAQGAALAGGGGQ